MSPHRRNVVWIFHKGGTAGSAVCIQTSSTKSSRNFYGIWAGTEPDREERVLAQDQEKKATGYDDSGAFVTLLRTCAKNKDLHNGTKLHCDILEKGLLPNCADALVIMYAKCGALAKAKEVFAMHNSPDVLTWTALISGYAHEGQPQDALNCFKQMQWEGIPPNTVTFVCVLKACGRLEATNMVECIHDQIITRDLLVNNIVLGNVLIDAYVKCGALAKARQVLEELPVRDVVSWNTLITGYMQEGQAQEALNCFEQMCSDVILPDEVTFICILKACSSIGAADKGEEIHNKVAKEGLLANDIVLGTALVDMYAKCGILEKAQKVLEELRTRDVVSWNALIAGYVLHNQPKQALKCFDEMNCEGISPNKVTFISILKACGTLQAADKGEQIYDEITELGFLADDVMLGTAAVDMYAKCGMLVKARQVLEELPFRGVASWNALIAGHVQQGDVEHAVSCFERMQCEGVYADRATFIPLLKACGSTGSVDKGEQSHHEIIKKGLLGKDIELGTALVDMYAKCGVLWKAQLVLEELCSRDVVSWNALITGYCEQGQGEEALDCFEHMKFEGISPSNVTFISALKACGIIGAADKGEKVHKEIIRQGLVHDNIMLGNALVDMYAKCGALVRAQEVLQEELPVRSVISWNALVAGYSQLGQGEEALSCVQRMLGEDLSPNEVTFSCMLKACGSIGAPRMGENIHHEIARRGLMVSNAVLGNALIDMYAKCGALVRAKQVLEELSACDIVAWNALITGYAQQGQGEEVLNCFRRMQHEGLAPDAGTFSSVLSVCGLLGLVEVANMYFVSMITNYAVVPDSKHDTSMVDVFGRAGHLDKAVRVFQKMLSLDNVVCSALLGSCRKWGDVGVGRWIFELTVQVDKRDAQA